MEDGDRYNLQYRTANDGKVRPEHAAMHGITLLLGGVLPSQWLELPLHGGASTQVKVPCYRPRGGYDSRRTCHR